MARYMKIFLLIVSLIVLDSSLIHALDSIKPGKATQPLGIISITPSGEDVPAGRQIVFQFNRPVVPVGRMNRDASEIPIIITPEVKGQWRWLNTSTLAFMLDEMSALSPATRYEITVFPGIKAEDGATLNAPVEHIFITERPKVLDTSFKTWGSPGMPIIQITFNQPVSQDSVKKHLFIIIKGQEQIRINVTVQPDPDYKEIPRILQLPGENLALITTAEQTGQSEEKKETGSEATDIEARRLWLVSPNDELPLDSAIEMNIEPGLESSLGPEKGVEDRILATLYTYPSFTFLGLECTDNKKGKVLIEPEKSADDQCLCNPQGGISLVFSSPVINREVKENMTIEPDLAGDRIDYDSWANRVSYSILRSRHRRDQKYRVWLPGPFKANQVYSLKSKSDKFCDVFGRILANPIDIRFTTDHLLPAYYLSNIPAVLEKNVDTDMPLAVTNLDNLTLTYDRLTAKGKDSSLKLEISPPKVRDLMVQIPSQVREMINGHSGVVQGEIVSTPDVDKYSVPSLFFAQVTPFHVHVKDGYFNTMVWVTNMATGEPVLGARVKIYMDSYKGLSSNPEILAEGTTDSEGTVTLAGIEKIEPELSRINPSDRQRLFVRVEKGEDIAILSLDNEFNVDASYSVRSQMRRKYGHIHTWGATAQGVYQVGDTIHYKIYVRDQNNQTFIAAPRERYALKVVDPMGKTVFEAKDLVLSEFGALQGEFTVPKTGAVGWYQFHLSSSFSELIWEPMEVLVSDFTPSPFKVTTDINGQNYQPGDKMKVTTKARLHDGGSYGDASARITVTLKRQNFLQDFLFDDRSASGFYFDNPYDPEFQSEQILNQAEGLLDKMGNLITDFNLSDSNILFGELVTESAVRDDRGKYIAGRTTAKYASRDRFVGLSSTDRHLIKDDPSSIDILVVDTIGKPVAGIPVSIKVEREETLTTRVKGEGNAYLTRYKEKWTVVESRVLESGDQPLDFSYTPKETGHYRITACIKDSKGREHSTQIYQRIVSKGSVIREESENNRLEIIAEKSGYKVGETARYLVKNPFPGAKALITIERYGVLKHWVQTLDAGTPVLEVKIEKDFIPGYFFSVVVMSPRTDKPQGDDQEDLGKPTFRMGYEMTTVDDPYKELNVEIKPAKETYKPGDRVKVDLHTTPRHDNSNEPIELAVVVLDEEILALLSGDKDHFDPYKGFYTMKGLGVKNSNLLMHLVGRLSVAETDGFTLEEITVTAQKRAYAISEQNYGVPGDDGMEKDLRSVFKFVSYWNPSIIPDVQGRASIEFEAPDNLTGWRVLVMAVTPSDRMGLGEGHFAVNKSTEIRPVMPNQVTEGDSFQAGFSIMNRTDNTRDLTMRITAEGAIEPDEGRDLRQITQELTLAPYERSTVFLPITTKGDGKISFTARGGDTFDQDGIVHELEVRKMASLETAATYGTSVSGTVTESLQFPDDIRTDVGKVNVSLSPSVIGQVEGAFRYLRDYPYICWEQVLTRGVMASHYQNLKKYMSDEFTWEGSKDLPQSMLDQAATYQAPNGGMAYYIPQDRYADPYLSAYTAIAFIWLKESGYKVPASVQDKLNEYLITMLQKEVTPDFYSSGMASTVRAVALSALAKQGKITLDDLRRYQPHINEMDLFGKAHFFMAAIGIKGAKDMREEVLYQILSHADQTGGKFVFNETFDDSYLRILTSSLRTNAAVLSALVAYGKTEEGKTIIGDIPFKMVRYISQTRKKSGRWENTQGNIFCMNALIDYSRVYESENPDMSLIARLDDEKMGEAKFKDIRDNPVELKRTIHTEDPGRKTAVTIEREGDGRLYYSVGLSYAPLKLNTESINAGIDVRREYSMERDGKWILLKSPMEIKRGDLVRVDLYVSLPTARNFVVVDDPVPGGLEPVNRDLATSSAVDADKGEYEHAEGSWWFHYGDWSYYGISRWSFYHRELRHDAVRFYSEYLPAGNYHLSYTAQAISSGEFIVMPTHVEEMYDPDIFGKASAATLNVKMEQ